MSEITNLQALEILDSRGHPTVQVTATLASGARAIAMVPSGASTGILEAVELRDGDKRRYLGKGVSKAVANVNGEIIGALKSFPSDDQAVVDHKLIELDGTTNKGRLGANALLGVSMACDHSMANEQGVPRYRSLCDKVDSYVLPVPMCNVMNGRQHADNNVGIQEFMIMPIGLPTFSAGLRPSPEIFHTLKAILKGKTYGTAVGDEGGFAPELKSNEEPMELLVEAIEAAGYSPGEEVWIAIDAASSELYKDDKYVFADSEPSRRSPAAMADLWAGLCEKYPVISLEDGCGEVDHDGWPILTEKTEEIRFSWLGMTCL